MKKKAVAGERRHLVWVGIRLTVIEFVFREEPHIDDKKKCGKKGKTGARGHP